MALCAGLEAVSLLYCQGRLAGLQAVCGLRRKSAESMCVHVRARCRHMKEASNAFDTEHPLHTFSIGIAGSPDLAAARKACPCTLR